jgi:hypothetical protein
MKNTIYIFSKGLFYAFTAFFLFIVVFSALAFVEYQLGWDVPFVDLSEKNNEVYAFINLPLIELGVGFPFKIYVLFVMWIGILFYVIYFYMLKEFFKVFIEEKVFSSKSLKRLKLFLYINLVPLLYALGLSIYQIIQTENFKFEEDQGMALVHLFVAFLVYLYMDIVKKGSLIQEENDLTI